ncbi:endonuclease domain-containing 1 protein-like [Colossoma macropomum]|uniref:endonuclease domain-containing 1 protein-like n=1 Tax=Colossoma macropomum TaxID=42526 RepID=UPI0018640EF1|nr:endonuclease domain-containing 1 protein-like [Colossoma macropomum]
MKLHTLLLLLGFPSLSVSEVVQSFKETCPEFFIRNPYNQNEVITPTVFKGEQYKQICQRWKGQYRYATLYDRLSRIPVYSAYTFTSKGKSIRPDEWMIEPQLDLPSTENNKEMKVMTPDIADKILFQAKEKDYTSVFTKGHVFPNGYAVDQEQAESSFTLTNAAPQTGKSNEEWANQVENPMLKEIKKLCKLNNPAYIVTGVVPGEKWLPIEIREKSIKNGLNIPSHYWTAFSCVNNKKEHISKAYLAQQINPYLNIQFDKREMTVDELNSELTKLYKQAFSVFMKKLQRRNTVKF